MNSGGDGKAAVRPSRRPSATVALSNNSTRIVRSTGGSGGRGGGMKARMASPPVEPTAYVPRRLFSVAFKQASFAYDFRKEGISHFPLLRQQVLPQVYNLWQIP